jgi:mono/diheme cytochrome c family protein
MRTMNRMMWMVGSVLLGVAAAAVAQAPPGAKTTQTTQPAAVPPALTIASLAGRDTFEAYCAPCHGQSGAGDGPVAASLKAPTADLRRMALGRAGVFPRAETIAFVTGKGRPIAAHGPADMPVWGPTFRALDPNDVLVKVRIENVVDYLQTLQLK